MLKRIAEGLALALILIALVMLVGFFKPAGADDYWSENGVERGPDLWSDIQEQPTLILYPENRQGYGRPYLYSDIQEQPSLILYPQRPPHPHRPRR